MITYSIKEFKAKNIGDISSSWLIASKNGGSNLSSPDYIVGFVNSIPSSIRLQGKSDIREILPELQEKVGGEKEESKYGFNFDVFSIEKPEIEMNPQEIAEVFGFIVDKLKIKKCYINTHSKNAK
jgi:hypothetical protein